MATNVPDTGPGHQSAPGNSVAELTITKRLLLALVGATPVSLIGFAAFGVVGLKELALLVLAPALCSLAALLVADKVARLLVLEAVLAGLVATVLYDVFRWSFLLAGWMDRDPIPHIGTSLDLTPGWFYGYLWRFVGNGGGLAIAFFAAGARHTLAGAVYGLAVCGGLLGVLALSPHGQQMLFPLGPATLIVAVVGHLIYGSALGYISQGGFTASDRAVASQ